jgi:hypothetical protein
LSELRLQIRSLDDLREQWNRSLRYGALMGVIEPMPTVGASVTVTIVPDWGGPSVVVDGTVLEATIVASIVQLDGLSEQAAAALQALGIDEAAASPSTPSISASEQSEVSVGQVLVDEESVASISEANATQGGDEESDSNSAPETPLPSGAFAPVSQGGGLAPPPQGAFAPAVPGASSEVQSAAPIAAGSGSQTKVDLEDPRQITAASRAGTPAAVALLPEPSHEGDFGSSSWRDTLLSLLEQRATGVLVIRALREMRWCYLVDGEPVHYLGDQPHPGEFLSDMLISEGLVTRESWNGTLRSQGITGMKPGEILLSSGAIQPKQFNKAILARAERITQNLMGMNFGRFSFHPYEELKKIFPFDQIDLLSLLLSYHRNAVARLDDEEVYKQTEEFYRKHVQIPANRVGMVSELELTEIEKHFSQVVIPAGWPLAEMLALREMEERSLLRFVLILQGMGMLEFVDGEGDRAKRNRAERYLYETLGDVVRRNAFEAVGAHWSSSVEQIEESYKKIKHRSRLERFEPYMDARIKELFDAVHERLDALWEELKLERNRKEIRGTFVEMGQLRMASDLLHSQGGMALYKNDFALARVCYVRVLELDPGGADGAENIAAAKKALSDPQLSATAVSESGVDMAALQRRLEAAIS